MLIPILIRVAQLQESIRRVFGILLFSRFCVVLKGRNPLCVPRGEVDASLHPFRDEKSSNRCSMLQRWFLFSRALTESTDLLMQRGGWDVPECGIHAFIFWPDDGFPHAGKSIVAYELFTNPHPLAFVNAKGFPVDIRYFLEWPFPRFNVYAFASLTSSE